MFAQESLPANASHRPARSSFSVAGGQLQAGQVLLIVILIIVISSTIGLSLASRSITSLRTSTEEAESQKALSAAEIGIERAIQTNVIPRGSIRGEIPSNNSSYSTGIDEIKDSNNFIINGGSTVLDATSSAIIGIIPNTIPKDEGADVWFVDHGADNTPDYSRASNTNFLNLYWGSSSSEDCNTKDTMPAAIEVIVVTRNPSAPNEIRSYRYAYDSCLSRRAGNNFTEGILGSFSKDYDNDNRIDITFGHRTPANHLARGINNIVLMRVIPIYKDAAIGVDTCNPQGENCTDLPSQGYIISSTGKSGATNRKITVFKGYPQTYLPYLSYGLFVPN